MTRILTSFFGFNQAGRDLVVGDVHGCFRTLDRALAELDFDTSRDRLFGVGDLVNRGPHSEDALSWLETRFAGVTLGNHERAVRAWFRGPNRDKPQGMMRWLQDIPRADYRRWWKAFSAMPVALTIETRHGPVGIVHAEVPHPVWCNALALFDGGSVVALDVALLGFEDKELAEHARHQPVEGLRALVHGHFIVPSVTTTANRWNIDTGAGFSTGQLSIIEVNSPELRAWTFDIDDF